MDTETKDAIDAVRGDLREVKTSLRAELREVETHVRTELGETETRLRTEFRHEIREEGSTTRRHFDVVAESLRDDIRIMAEGLVTLDAKVDAMRRT
jgi:hypothetical protein